MGMIKSCVICSASFEVRHNPQAKTCGRACSVALRRALKAKRRQDPAYREAERARAREQMRKYYEANPEKRREQKRKYYEANSEKRREYDRKYREANREKMRKYREANREKMREYREANREKLREQRHTHKHRKRGNGGHTTPAQFALLAELMPACLRCGETENLHWDHVVPVKPADPWTPGGTSWPDNYQRLCASCNLWKGNRSTTDYRTAGMVAQIRAFCATGQGEEAA